MEKFVGICLSLICVVTPLLFLLLTGGIYALGIGAFKIPGISRKEVRPGKDWITVPNLARKTSETLAAALSLVGALFGIVGFLLPWVSVNVGSAGELLDLGGLSGSLSGIALAFQSFVGGIGLFSADLGIKGVQAIAVTLIMVSLFVSLIPLALLVTAAVGIGLVSVPLGLLKVNIRRLSKALLIMSIISLCLVCSFFTAIQATVGGVKVGGSEGLFGTSMQIGVQVSTGFWITVGGLILALVGAIAVSALSKSLETWADNLTKLDQGTAEESNNLQS